MKATDYWKQQADELLGKKKDPAKGNETATPTTNQNQTTGESTSTPQKTNQLSQILDNLLEDEEDDDFMGNSDVLDDSVLDVESDFFASDRKINNNNNFDENHDYFYHYSYVEASKYILRDGSTFHAIPKYQSREKNNLSYNRYFYLVANKEVLNDTPQNPYQNQNNARFLKYGKPFIKYENGIGFEYVAEYDYLQINSPMTFKGGDENNSTTGFGYDKIETSDFSSMKDILEKWAIQSQWKRGYTIDMWKDIGKDKIKKLLYLDKFFPSNSSNSFLKSSIHKGKLDFKYQLNLDKKTLYEINGVLYNKNEAGNFGYGYALAFLGFNIYDVDFVAHQGTIIIDKRRQFDEPWELDALYDGFYFFYGHKSNSSDAFHNKINMYENPNK